MLKTLAASTALLLWAAGTALAGPPQDQKRDLVLEFDSDGRVRLLAHNVSVQDILAEWARRCQCFVVNGDRLPATPVNVPILYDRVPQAAVLRSLLKDAGGYVLTPKRADAAGPSAYETIYILPAAAGRAMPVAAFGAPFVPPPAVVTPGSPDDEIEPVRPVVTPIAVDPSAANAPPESPRAPGVGVSVPAVQIVPITPAGGPAPTNAPRPGTVPPPPPAPVPAPAAPVTP